MDVVVLILLMENKDLCMGANVNIKGLQAFNQTVVSIFTDGLRYSDKKIPLNYVLFCAAFKITVF